MSSMNYSPMLTCQHSVDIITITSHTVQRQKLAASVGAVLDIGDGRGFGFFTRVADKGDAGGRVFVGDALGHDRGGKAGEASNLLGVAAAAGAI